MDRIVLFCVIGFISLGVIEYIIEFSIRNKESKKKTFWIKTNFIHFLIWVFIGIPNFVYQMIITAGNLLACIPNFIRYIAGKWDYYHLESDVFPKVTNKVGNFFKDCFARFNSYIKKFKNQFKKNDEIKEKLAYLYAAITKVVPIDNPKIGSTFYHHIIEMVIWVIQFGISYFTTLAGAQLVFSSVSPIAPFAFALSIQVLIVLFSKMAFQRKRKTKALKTALLVSVIISVGFSYTGIVIAQDSPKIAYKTAYEAYLENFNSAKQTILDKLGDSSKAAESLKNIVRDLNGNLSFFQAAKDARNNLMQQTNGIPMVYYTQDENQMRVPHVVDNIEVIFNNTMNSNDQIAIFNHVIDVFEEELNGNDQLNFDEQIDAFTNTIAEDKDADTADNVINNLRKLMNVSNTAVEQINTDGELSLKQFEEEELDTILSRLRDYSAVNNIVCKDITDVFKDESTPDDGNSLGPLSEGFFNDLFNTAKNVFSTAMANDMDNLATQRQTVREQSKSSYDKLMVYIEKYSNENIIDDNLKNALSEKKAEVNKLPNIFSYAFSRFKSEEVNPFDYVLIFFIASLIDAGAALLGFVKENKQDSFIYVKSSKDYYEQYDDLFGFLFLSLMKTLEDKITLDQLNLKNNEYQTVIENYIDMTARYIEEFLGKFSISEATWTQGFNLKCKKDENLEKFQPIISILIETNLLKLITERQYNIILNSVYQKNIDYNNDEKGSQNIEVNDDTVYYYLLRSKGENFMRENIPFSFKQVKSKDTKNSENEDGE